jgi:hypothetical protein
MTQPLKPPKGSYSMLKLDRRTATLVSVNPRNQKHGTENVTAMDIQLQGIPLSEEELGVVLQNDQAAKRLLIRKKGRPAEPIFGKVACNIPFMAKVDGVSVKLFLGRRLFAVTDAKLNRIRVELRQGIMAWHVQIQCVPDLDESHPTIEALLSKLGDSIDFELECPSYGAQPELPLEEEEDDGEESEEDDDGEGDDESESSGRRARKRA